MTGNLRRRSRPAEDDVSASLVPDDDRPTGTAMRLGALRLKAIAACGVWRAAHLRPTLRQSWSSRSKLPRPWRRLFRRDSGSAGHGAISSSQARPAPAVSASTGFEEPSGSATDRSGVERQNRSNAF